MYYEVYVRNYNGIKEYKEDDIQRYMVRHKELSEEELDYQSQALHPFITLEEAYNFLSKLNLINREDDNVEKKDD